MTVTAVCSYYAIALYPVHWQRQLSLAVHSIFLEIINIQ